MGMNYKQLTDRLTKEGRIQLLSTVERVIDDEAAALVTGNSKQARVRARIQAAGYYAAEIGNLLDNTEQLDSELTPDQILHYRRYATAWAIARLWRG
jgi:hypothetical protein